MDFADARNRGDERRFVFAREAADLRESKFECVSHIPAGHIAGSEYKFANGVLLKGAFFEQVIPDALVRR